MSKNTLYLYSFFTNPFHPLFFVFIFFLPFAQLLVAQICYLFINILYFFVTLMTILIISNLSLCLLCNSHIFLCKLRNKFLLAFAQQFVSAKKAQKKNAYRIYRILRARFISTGTKITTIPVSIYWFILLTFLLPHKRRNQNPHNADVSRGLHR